MPRTAPHPDTPFPNMLMYIDLIVQSCEIVSPAAQPRRPVDWRASSTSEDLAEQKTDCVVCTDLQARNATEDNCSVRRTSCPTHLDFVQTARDHSEDQSILHRDEFENPDFQRSSSDWSRAKESGCRHRNRDDDCHWHNAPSYPDPSEDR